jgi:chromatin remodeling complex protein RSC6
VPKKVAAVPAVVAAPTPVAAEKKVVKRAASVEPAASVAETPVAETPVAEQTEETSWQVELKAVQDQLSAIRDAAALALGALKRLEKRASREIKDAAKNRRKARREASEGAERKPSVFKTPIPVSDDLAVFLGEPKGSLMSRSGVTKAISVYVKEHKLNDKHAIKADSALQKLLGVSPTDELTIFNLQRYLNPHYIKTVKA